MDINLIEYMIYLIPIMIIYYIVPVRNRWIILLGTNFIFYMNFGIFSCVLLVALLLLTYFVTIMIARSNYEKNKKRYLLTGIITVLICALSFYKYFNIIANQLNIGLSIIVPIGISYLSFKLISYIIDVYRDNTKVERHLGYFSVYVMLFPQIVCGPIERAGVVLEQIRKGLRYNADLFSTGAEYIVLGLFKKFVIASRCAGYVDYVWGNIETCNGLTLFIAMLLYSLQIYCDFSGYSDIAIGILNMLGLRSSDNFKYPYLSRNINEFWKTWHISLTTWFRDYLYIPLGGNRVSNIRNKINIIIVFVLSAIWHGLGMTFLIWGLIHGIWSCLSKNGRTKISRIKNICTTIFTFIGVSFAWLFFRAPSVEIVIQYICNMFTKFSFSIKSIFDTVIIFTMDSASVSFAMLLLVSVIILLIYEYINKYVRKTGYFYIGVIFMLVVLVGEFSASGFIYANF